MVQNASSLQRSPDPLAGLRKGDGNGKGARKREKRKEGEVGKKIGRGEGGKWR